MSKEFWQQLCNVAKKDRKRKKEGKRERQSLYLFFGDKKRADVFDSVV